MPRRIRPGGPFLVPEVLAPPSGPTGVVGPAEYQWGTHAVATNTAEQIKSAIWRSARAAVATGLGAFVVSVPQVYADQPGPIFPSVRAGQRPPVAPVVQGAPQFADLTLQASLWKPVCGPQGPTVRQFVGGPLPVDLTLQAQLEAPPPQRQGPVPALAQGAPQLADLTIQAQFEAPPPQRQGGVPALTATPPQQTEDGQARLVWRSLVPPPIVQNPIAAFFSIPPQTEERPTRQIWPSQTAGKTPPVIPVVQGAPQFADLTLQAQLEAPPPQRQGPVPPITATPPQQTEDGQARLIWRSLVAPPIVPNPIAAFFSVPPQTEERPTRQIWASQTAGKTPRIIPPIWGAPQLLDFTQQGTVIKPSLAPAVVSYAFRSIYGAPQLVDLIQQAWLVGKLPSRHGRVPPAIFASQADPSQIAAAIFPRAYPSATPGVFPPESPLHFRIVPDTVRLGELVEAPPAERLGELVEVPPAARLGEATETVKTARLGEATETPEAERIGSATTKPPAHGSGSSKA